MEKQFNLPWTNSVEEHLSGFLHAILQNVEELEGSEIAFEQARIALECLPLTTNEFGLAVNRLENARKYLQQNEKGAARFELRQLIRGLNLESAENLSSFLD